MIRWLKRHLRFHRHWHTAFEVGQHIAGPCPYPVGSNQAHAWLFGRASIK